MKRIQVCFPSVSLKEALIETRNRVSDREIADVVTSAIRDLFQEAENNFGPERTFLLQLLANYFRTKRELDQMEPLLELLNTFETPLTDNGKHAHSILCNNFIAQYHGGSTYGAGSAKVNSAVVQLLDDDNLRLLAGHEDLEFDPECFDIILDALTKCDHQHALSLSKYTLSQMRVQMERILNQTFLARELGIPMVDAPVDGQVFDEFEMQRIANSVQEAGASKTSQDASYKYLDEADVRALTSEAAEISRSIHTELTLDSGSVEKLAWILQALDQHLCVEPSAWKGKLVCGELYAALSFCAHYQFLHQPAARGRFRFFFGREVPRLRVTLLKVLSQLGENCPCAWDLARLFGTLGLLALGYLGDGEAAGAKEVCAMGLHWHCQKSPENVAFLKK